MKAKNMQHITPIIDYRKIVEAKEFYEHHGFTEIAVPWILDYESYSATRPADRKEFYTLGGYLNASGEQGFIELLLRGVPLQKHMCITPCFRDEPVRDDIHHTYFVKLELINMNITKENLNDMLCMCQKFFAQYMKEGMTAQIIKTQDGEETSDIVDSVYGIELGSYGIRRYKHLSWIYGTGVALPRLSTVLGKDICTPQSTT